MRIYEDERTGVWKAEMSLDYYKAWKYTAIGGFIFIGILLFGAFYNECRYTLIFYNHEYMPPIDYPNWIAVLTAYPFIILGGLYHFLRAKGRSGWWAFFVLVPVIGFLVILIVLILRKKTDPY